VYCTPKSVNNFSDHSSFPYLEHFLGAYFHQDFDVVHGSFEGTIADFVKDSQPYDVAGLRADIERYLATTPHELLESFNRKFSPSIIIGGSDVAARRWLTDLAQSLRDASGA
jgi:hypothetical protein